MSAATPLDAARAYLRRGWAPVPIPYKEKYPHLRGWQRLEISEADLPRYFNGQQQNIGILLGAPSGGLADVDLDTRETYILGPRFLPPTAAVFGRPGAPASHWFYIVSGGLRSDAWRDPLRPKDDERATLAELRGSGRQTVVPPSVHPCGEPITWVRNDEPAEIELAVLRHQMQQLAAAGLLARYWPAPGNRQEAALALGGGLLRGGWTEERVAAFIDAVAFAAGDEETEQRAKTARYSARAINAERRTTGWPTLAKLIPDEVVDTMREWLGVRTNAGPAENGNQRTDRTDKTSSGSFGSASGEQNDEFWPERAPLPPKLLPVPTLPAGMVPAPLRPWLVNAAARTCLPLEMLAVPAIVAAGSVIGRAIGIRPGRFDDFVVVPNLWGASVNRPGSLKTGAISEAFRPLGRLIARAHEEYLKASEAAAVEAEALDAQIEAIKKEMREAARNDEPLDPLKERLAAKRQERADVTVRERRYMTHDATIEKLGELLRDNPRGLLQSRDELSGWLRAQDRPGREGDREFYLEAWNGTGSFTTDRIGRGTIHIPTLCLSVFGGIQPGKLRPLITDAIDGGAGDDGLLQRLQMLVWPDRLPTWRKPEGWPDADARERADRIFERLDQMNPFELRVVAEDEIPFLTFTPAAQVIFDQWRDELEHRLRSNDLDNSPAFASHLAKYRSLMPALALIFELIPIADGEHTATGQVGEAATRLAAAWCEFLEHHARKLYAAELAGGIGTAHTLAAKIEAGAIAHGDSVRAIYLMGWSGLKTPDRVLTGLSVLADHGWLRLVTRTSGTQGGRPSQVVHLHPALRAHATEDAS